MNKNDLRKEYKKIRSSLDEEFVCNAAKKVCSLISSLDAFKNASTVMCYSAIGSELSLTHLISHAATEGKCVLLPVTDTASETMHASVMENTDELSIGAYNIFEPSNRTPYDESKIDVVIVPGLVFSKNGYRIGYGKGYYDKFLSKNPHIYKIGAAFDAQLSDESFIDIHDVRLDVIVTEKGVIYCEG